MSDSYSTMHQHILDRLEVLRALPLWVQAAYSLSFYRPEAIVHLLWDDWGAQLHQPEVAEQDRSFVYFWAAHQINRFGAGPALRPDILEQLREKAMTYPEYLG